MDSEKCNKVIDKLNMASEANVSQESRNQAMKLATEIKTELNKPTYSFYRKGRYRDFAPRPLNIFDGII